MLYFSKNSFVNSSNFFTGRILASIKVRMHFSPFLSLIFFAIWTNAISIPFKFIVKSSLLPRQTIEYANEYPFLKEYIKTYCTDLTHQITEQTFNVRDNHSGTCLFYIFLQCVHNNFAANTKKKKIKSSHYTVNA